MTIQGEIISIDTRSTPYILLIKTGSDSTIDVTIPFDCLDIVRKLREGFIASIEVALVGKQYWNKAQKRLRGYNTVLLKNVLECTPKIKDVIKKETQTITGTIQDIFPMIGLMPDFRRVPIIVRDCNGKEYKMDLRGEYCFSIKHTDMWDVKFEIEYFKTTKKDISPYQIVKIERTEK
jgi:hypothetical protein